MENAPGKGTGGSTGDQVKEQVGQSAQSAAQTVQQTAGQVAQTAETRATSFLDTQKGQAAEKLTGVASALDQVGSSLHTQGQTGIAGLADQAADRVRDVAGYLQSQSTGDLVSDAEGFARRRPGIFLAGTFALGFLAARFLKSSPPQQSSISGNGTGSVSGQPQGQYDTANVPHAYTSTQGMPDVDVQYARGWTEGNNGTAS